MLNKNIDIRLSERSRPQLGTGSPPFPISSVVKQAIKEIIDQSSYSIYPPSGGIPELRKEFTKFYELYHGVSYKPENVLVTNGAMQALSVIFNSVLTPNDEVLLPAPFWFVFPYLIRKAKSKFRAINTQVDNNFKLTPKLLLENITSKSRILVFTNPTNPSGAVYSYEEIEELVEVLKRFPQLLIVSDEVWNLLLIDGTKKCPSMATWPEIKHRVFTVNSISKNYSLGGLRVGFVATNGRWEDGRAWINGQSGFFVYTQNYQSIGVNEFSQYGALVALKESEQIVTTKVKDLIDKKLKAQEILKQKLPNISFISPQAGYFFFINIERYINSTANNGVQIKNDIDLANYLEVNSAIKVVPSTHCGIPGYLRITYALENSLFEEYISTMANTLNTLYVNQ